MRQAFLKGISRQPEKGRGGRDFTATPRVTEPFPSEITLLNSMNGNILSGCPPQAEAPATAGEAGHVRPDTAEPSPGKNKMNIIPLNCNASDRPERAPSNERSQATSSFCGIPSLGPSGSPVTAPFPGNSPLEEAFLPADDSGGGGGPAARTKRESTCPGVGPSPREGRSLNSRTRTPPPSAGVPYGSDGLGGVENRRPDEGPQLAFEKMGIVSSVLLPETRVQRRRDPRGDPLRGIGQETPRGGQGQWQTADGRFTLCGGREADGRSCGAVPGRPLPGPRSAGVSHFRNPATKNTAATAETTTVGRTGDRVEAASRHRREKRPPPVGGYASSERMSSMVSRRSMSLVLPARTATTAGRAKAL